MNSKKSFGEKLNDFFAGKGFYIVLSLCAAIIGVSAWFLFAQGGTDTEAELSDIRTTENVTQEVILSGEAYEPAPPEMNSEPQGEKDDAEPLPQESDTDAKQEDQNSTPAWNQQEEETAAQFIWPLEGNITLPYSVAALVYHETLGDWRTSDGVSISAPLGTVVQAVCSGKVESVENDDLRGTTVVIAHAGGIRSIYSNLAAVPTVYPGDDVMTGEVIGSLGTTAPGQTAELTTLRLKMTLDGQSVDPGDYLPPR